MKKILASAFFALALAAGSVHAQVYVRVGPPPVRVERRPPSPSPRHVWVGGFYRWDGRGYVWMPGYWARPPRPRAVWVPGRWVQQRRGGWVWIDGRWR
jgi:hypothetical protein